MRFDSCWQHLELRTDRRGISSLEFTLLGPLLALLLLGAADLGGAMQQGLLLRQAVRAGALYAMQWPTDSVGITRVMAAALPSSWTNADLATATSCACWSEDSGIAAAPSCTCPDGESLQKLMQLSASRAYSPLLLRSITSTAASDVIRTQ